MGKIKIITLDPERWHEYRELRLRALREEPAAFGSSYEENVDQPEAFWRGRLEEAQRKVESIALFAEVDGRLAGMMGAHWTLRLKTGHVASVYGVYVDRAIRGRGIGRLLMQALLDEIALIPRIEKLNLTVNPTQATALTLYQAFGFEVIGTAHKELKVGDQYYDEYLMEKLL